MGRSFKDFTLTNNECRAAETRLEELENDLVFVEGRVATGLQTSATRLEQFVEKGAVGLERELVKDVTAIEKEVVKDAIAVEKEVEKDVLAFENEVQRDFKKMFLKDKKL